jgi:hypothetical protein
MFSFPKTHGMVSVHHSNITVIGSYDHRLIEAKTKDNFWADEWLIDWGFT